MKKTMMTGLMVLVTLAGVSLAGPTAALRKLTINEAADRGATHAVTFRYSDFATYTGTNGTYYTNTAAFPVLAKQGVELVAMVLTTPFEYTATNGLSSILVEVGDGTDTDLYLTSTEICVNGTEVFLKFGRAGGQSDSVATATATSVTTNFVQATAAGGAGTLSTNAVTFLSALSQTANTVASVGRKVYTAADTVDFLFTPTGTEWSLSQCNKGEVTFFFKITDAAVRP